MHNVNQSESDYVLLFRSTSLNRITAVRPTWHHSALLELCYLITVSLHSTIRMLSLLIVFTYVYLAEAKHLPVQMGGVHPVVSALSNEDPSSPRNGKYISSVKIVLNFPQFS